MEYNPQNQPRRSAPAGYNEAAYRRKLEMRRKRRRQKQIRFYGCCTLLLLAAVALGVGIYFLVQYFGGRAAVQQPSSQSLPQSSSVAVSVSSVPVSSAPVVRERTWELLLANVDNPLPASYDAEVTFATPFTNSAQQIDRRASQALTQMFNDAAAAGVPLYFRSGYRSYATQEYLFNSMQQGYMAQGMSETDAYAATRKLRNPAGTSEHQTGLAADITPASNPQANLVSGLEDTPEIQWLHQHCQEYGFILRYPKDKTDITGTSYEPWHFRYVGVEAATEIMAEGLCLEEYLEKYYS